MKVLPIFLILLSMTLSVQAQAYRWVDENGVVSYSQTPPPSQETESVQLKSRTTGDSSQAKERLDNLRQRLDKQRENRQKAKDAAEKAKQEKTIRKKNCETARSNLRKLEALGSRLLMTSDGTHQRLTEEERQKRIKDAQEKIKINCTN